MNRLNKQKIIPALAFILSFMFTITLTFFSPSNTIAAGSSLSQSITEPLVVGSEGMLVYLMQKRLEDLGFYSFRATGIYGSITRNSVVAFQQANDIIADGTVGDQTYGLIFGSSANRPYASSSLSQEKGPKEQSDDSSKITGQILTWEKVDSMMRKNKEYTVVDYYTQKSYTVIRTGGKMHADVECATNLDFTTYRNTFGGDVSWEKRPVVVIIGSEKIAASAFGMPHGKNSLATNGMSGHICLYFSGSTLDDYPIQDVEHEEILQIATGK